MKQLQIVLKKVETIYTPAAGVIGRPDRAIADINWMLACAEPEAASNKRLEAAGLVKPNEFYQIAIYLRQVRQEIRALHPEVGHGPLASAISEFWRG